MTYHAFSWFKWFAFIYFASWIWLLGEYFAAPLMDDDYDPDW